MLQYYMHARHLALSRTFPDKFEMEPSAPLKVKCFWTFHWHFSCFTGNRGEREEEGGAEREEN